MGQGGGGGGIDPHEQEIALIKALAKELQVAALDGAIPEDWVEDAESIASIAVGEIADNLAAGDADWEGFKQTGTNMPVPGGENFPINWGKFDWTQIPGARSVPTYAAALQDAINWANSKGG